MRPKNSALLCVRGWAGPVQGPHLERLLLTCPLHAPLRSYSDPLLSGSVHPSLPALHSISISLSRARARSLYLPRLCVSLYLQHAKNAKSKKAIAFFEECVFKYRRLLLSSRFLHPLVGRTVGDTVGLMEKPYE